MEQKDILERSIIVFLLIITTGCNLKLGLLVCFIVIVIFLNTSSVSSSLEGFSFFNNNNNTKEVEDCDVVKIPTVNVMTTTDYTAIIVEPRKHRALEFVLKNFTENLSADWNFMIYHGSENMKMVQDIISRFSPDVQNRITLINLNVRNLNIKQYSTMFYCPTFYDNIPTETFLIFQTDSMILKENKNKIYDFMKYDYVGAPWPRTMGIHSKMEIGNGGLSLRKKSKMVELLKYKEKGIENKIFGKYRAEDQFFGGFFVPEVKVYKPTFIKAKEFSVEAVYYDAPFGVHKPWYRGNLNVEEYIKLSEKYTEISILEKLQY